jgi:phosphatidylglycerol---prolipoprotein diacylglyceryl transferase
METVTHFFTWEGSPILLSIGPIALRWYGLLFGAGFFIGAKILDRLLLRDRLKIPALDALFISVLVAAIVGARLAHTLIYEPEHYLPDPLRILKVWEGGLASHGGAVGVLVGCWLWKRKHWPKGDLLTLIDYLAIPATLAGAMIRVGNFFNSEIIGSKSEVPWAIVFKKVDEFPRHPAMLYESFSYLIIFAVLLALWMRGVHRGRRGLLFGAYLGLVFGARFLIEFVKEPQVASEVGKALDFGQWLSIPFVLLGVYFVVRSFRREAVSTPNKRVK